MLEFLNQPIQYEQSAKTNWIYVIGASLFVFGFLFIFRPFDILDYLVISPFLAILTYALITFILTVSYFFGWRKSIRQFAKNKWTIRWELLGVLILLLLIGILNHFFILASYADARVLHRSHGEILLENLFFTFAVAFFPVVVIGYIEYTRNRELQDKQTSFEPTNSIRELISVTILGDGPESAVELSNHSFRFAKASGNYVEYFSFVDDGVVKELQRSTLSNVEEQLKSSSLRIVRTHRSYLVNLDAVTNASGNAQGYTVDLHGMEDKIPVSRYNVEEFNRVMNDKTAFQ